MSANLTVLFAFKLWLQGKKKLFNALVGQYLIFILKLNMAIGQLHNRLLSSSNARHFSTTESQRYQKTKDQLKGFDERIMNCTYTIQKRLHVTNHALRFPTNLDKCRYFGSGKFESGQ